jgi:hypothetical protein
MKKIFSDDALIITGNILQNKPQAKPPSNLGNFIVRRKSEYLTQLEKAFETAQFVNSRIASIVPNILL